MSSLLSTYYSLLLSSASPKWRGQDLNLRPRGYEPRELPDCSTPRHWAATSTESTFVVRCLSRQVIYIGCRGVCRETWGSIPLELWKSIPGLESSHAADQDSW